MSKEQAKEFFESISKDKQLAEAVKDVLGGQAANEVKAKALFDLAEEHGFNFTKNELKMSLSREDLADIAGGSGLGQAMAGLALSTMQVLGVVGNGGQQPLPEPNQIINVQQAAGNAQNQEGQQEVGENEAPPVVINEEENVDAERQRREEQEQREREARLAQGPPELNKPVAVPRVPIPGEWSRLTFGQLRDLRYRVDQLFLLSYQLRVYPGGRELAERLQVCINEILDIISSERGDFEFRLAQADSLIDVAEALLRQIQDGMPAEIQHGLDALALILRRTHTGLPGETDLHTDVQTFLTNRERYSREARIVRAMELLSRTRGFHNTLHWSDRLRLDDALRLFNAVAHFNDAMVAVLEERLENNALPWLARARVRSGVPGEHELSLEIREFLATLDGDVTDEHLVQMNSLLDRARELMMNRARAYTRFDTDQVHLYKNDLQLAQLLGIDKEYIQEKIKNKTVASREDIEGFIELSDGDRVAFHFFVGSGTLVLTGSGNTVIGSHFKDESLWKQLEEAGITFEVNDANGNWTDEQLLTRDYPFVVRNLIFGDGITEIGDDAFYQARSLRSVYFMGPVQFIGTNAFASAGYLVEFGFAQPEVLERIDWYACSDDYQLVSINIPQNADIAKTAFCWCEKLKVQGSPYCE